MKTHELENYAVFGAREGLLSRFYDNMSSLKYFSVEYLNFQSFTMR